MKRYLNIGLAFAQLLLLLAFTGTLPPATAMGARCTDTTAAVTSRCFPLDFATKVTWWIEIRSTRPVTSPGVLIMDAEAPTTRRWSSTGPSGSPDPANTSSA